MSPEILTHLEPLIADALGLALIAAIGWVTAMARRHLGLKAEVIWREALHRALTSGVAQAMPTGLDPMFPPGRIVPEITETSIVRDAVAYAERSVPDAIKGLRAGQDVLSDLARAKLAEATVTLPMALLEERADPVP